MPQTQPSPHWYRTRDHTNTDNTNIDKLGEEREVRLQALTGIADFGRDGAVEAVVVEIEVGQLRSETHNGHTQVSPTTTAIAASITTMAAATTRLVMDSRV
eukprot:690817-Rhodomonas_salina.2